MTGRCTRFARVPRWPRTFLWIFAELKLDVSPLLIRMSGLTVMTSPVSFFSFFLLNEKNEKRLIAVGSSPQTVINSNLVCSVSDFFKVLGWVLVCSDIRRRQFIGFSFQVLEGDGQVLNHIQSIILARRSMIRCASVQLNWVTSRNWIGIGYS